ncbi:MAG: SDR family oxidoreductase [Anaerolineales bacterium]
MELDGRYALVTGSGHRVGRAIAMALAARGVNLVVHCYHSSQAAIETVEQAQSYGISAQAIQADLRSPSSIETMFARLDQTLPQLDILINSAAIMERTDFLSATPQDWDRSLDLNLKGTFFCLQQAARRMLDGGVIVNISDIIGLRPWPGFPIHAISKAGVEMLTKAAALELAPQIRVNAIAPGPVLKPEDMNPERWQEIASPSPLGRPGQPEDIARAVIYLIENEYVTGETLVVDGGFQLT